MILHEKEHKGLINATLYSVLLRQGMVLAGFGVARRGRGIVKMNGWSPSGLVTECLSKMQED